MIKKETPRLVQITPWEVRKTLLCPRFEVQVTQFITLLEERVSIETKAQRPFGGFCSTPHSLNNYRHGFACYIERITTKKEERGQFGRLS